VAKQIWNELQKMPIEDAVADELMLEELDATIDEDDVGLHETIEPSNLAYSKHSKETTKPPKILKVSFHFLLLGDLSMPTSPCSTCFLFLLSSGIVVCISREDPKSRTPSKEIKNPIQCQAFNLPRLAK